MPPKYPRRLEYDPAELEDIDRILHLASHRNKNQHRLAKWWKSFSVLKRNVSKILADLKDHVKTRTSTSRAAVEERTEFICEFLMPKCYRSFGALVADNQFAAIGLMLMGTLARLDKILLPLRKEPEVTKLPVTFEKRDLPMEEIGELVPREELEDAEPQVNPKAKKQSGVERETESKSKKKSTVSWDDLEDAEPYLKAKKKRSRGEEKAESKSEKEARLSSTLPPSDIAPLKKQTRIEREPEGKSKKKARLSSTLSPSNVATPKPPKKKRKKGNAIDDLFSSIV